MCKGSDTPVACGQAQVRRVWSAASQSRTREGEEWEGPRGLGYGAPPVCAPGVCVYNCTSRKAGATSFPTSLAFGRWRAMVQASSEDGVCAWPLRRQS